MWSPADLWSSFSPQWGGLGGHFFGRSHCLESAWPPLSRACSSISGSFSFGLSRQTPTELGHTSGEWWVTPLLCGLDTGMIWTTCRVSSCSWVLLLLAVLGIAPAWARLVYGLAFSIPLLVMVQRRVSVEGSCEISRPHWMPQQPAQWVRIVSMLLLPAVLLWVHGA
jgi:hypothetical protein